jgi:hypothetical protein
MRSAAVIALVMSLCAMGLGAAAGVASASPSMSQAVYRHLSEEASAAFGESHFACLAPVWESPTGQRSYVSSERSVRIGFGLLITARRVLPAARRLRRAHRSILTVEVVGQRYSLASMRHLARVVRGAMAAFPSASVVFSPFDGFHWPLTVAGGSKSSEPPCPKVEVQLDGMPQVVSPGGPPPSSEEADSRAAAEALAARYGRMQLISAE